MPEDMQTQQDETVVDSGEAVTTEDAAIVELRQKYEAAEAARVKAETAAEEMRQLAQQVATAKPDHAPQVDESDALAAKYVKLGLSEEQARGFAEIEIERTNALLGKFVQKEQYQQDVSKFAGIAVDVQSRREMEAREAEGFQKDDLVRANSIIQKNIQRGIRYENPAEAFAEVLEHIGAAKSAPADKSQAQVARDRNKARAGNHGNAASNISSTGPIHPPKELDGVKFDYEGMQKWKAWTDTLTPEQKKRVTYDR